MLLVKVILSQKPKCVQNVNDKPNIKMSGDVNHDFWVAGNQLIQSFHCENMLLVLSKVQNPKIFSFYYENTKKNQQAFSLITKAEAAAGEFSAFIIENVHV